MMTKKQYAEYLIMAEVRDGNSPFISFSDISEEKLEELVGKIYSSTTLGIALETLGIISENRHPSEYEYLQNRGGTLAVFAENRNPDVRVLTVRELISLLPDTLED